MLANLRNDLAQLENLLCAVVVVSGLVAAATGNTQIGLEAATVGASAAAARNAMLDFATTKIALAQVTQEQQNTTPATPTIINK